MILGFGLPELFVILFCIALLAIFCAAAYFVIKAAVKRGATEAFDELKRDGGI